MNVQERRQHPRVPLVIRVMHRLADAYQYYYSVDISMGGIFLKTAKPFAVGTLLGLDFELPGRPRRVEVEGEVVRAVVSEPDVHDVVPGMGIVFTDISQQSLAELTSFLADA